MKRRALYFTSTHEVQVAEEPMEPLGDGQVVVRSVVSAVSAGTELLFLRGQVPPGMALDESIEELRERPIRYPLKYGYAMVGRVAEVAPNVDASLLGRLVFSFHVHESCFVATVDSLVFLPSNMSPERAALLPTMETALSLVMDSQPVIGERVVVVGLGMVGLLVTHLLSSMRLGCLVGVDAIPARREHARRLGAHAVVDSAAQDVVGTVRDQLLQSPGGADYHGADLAIELSGNAAALDVAIEVVGFDGRVVVGSWYGTKATHLGSLGGQFHRKHVELRSSQVSTLNPRWTGRWTKRRRLEAALALLEHMDERPLITHRFPIERAAEAYRALTNHPQDTVQVLLTYEES